MRSPVAFLLIVFMLPIGLAAQHVLPESELASLGVGSTPEVGELTLVVEPRITPRLLEIDSRLLTNPLGIEPRLAHGLLQVDSRVLAQPALELEIAPVCEVVFDFGDDGMKFGNFIDLAQKHTGLVFTFDRRQIDCSSQLVNLRGQVSVEQSQVGRFVQEVLLAHDMLLMRMGTGGRSIVQIVRINQSQYLKQNALPVAWDAIDGCASRPAEVFSCIVPLQNIDCQQMQRMLQNLIQEHRVAFVAPLADANAVMICGTGRQMTVFADAIRRSEALAASDRAKAWRDLRNQIQGPGRPTRR